MGMYDCYGNSQLKVGDCNFSDYKIGDTVTIPDGVYVAWYSVVVIVNGIFVAEFKNITTKWGSNISPELVLGLAND